MLQIQNHASSRRRRLGVYVLFLSSLLSVGALPQGVRAQGSQFCHPAQRHRGRRLDYAQLGGDNYVTFSGGTYDVYQKLLTDTSWTVLKTGLPDTTTSYKENGIVVGTAYEFEVVGHI